MLGKIYGKSGGITRAEWRPLEIHLPGRAVHKIGILLRDIRGDSLYVKIKPRWCNFWDKDVDLCCQLAEDLLRHACEIGVGGALDHLSGSHTIRLGEPREVYVYNFERVLKEIYKQNISGPGIRKLIRQNVELARQKLPRDRIRQLSRKCASLFRHRNIWFNSQIPALAVTTCLVAIVCTFTLTMHSTHPPLVQQLEGFPVVSLPPLRNTALDGLEIQQPARPPRGHSLRVRAVRHRKPFRIEAVKEIAATKPHLRPSHRPIPPPDYAKNVKYNPDPKLASLLPAEMPQVPRFRPKHNRFVRVFISIIAPFRNGATQKSTSTPI